MYSFNKNYLRSKRIELGLNQNDLAKKLGISRVMISKYENGEIDIPLSKFIALMNLLGAEPQYLFALTSAKTAEQGIGSYITDLSLEHKGFGSHTDTIAELIKLDIATVANPFCIKPNVFNYYYKNGKFPEGFFRELETVYTKITAEGWKANIRTPDIIVDKQSSIPYKIGNKIFINNYHDFKLALLHRFNGISDTLKEAGISKAKVSFLLQSTYDSDRCGIIQTDDGYGNILIEAALGQSTTIFSRDDVEPDMYLISKSNLKIKSKKISHKEHEWLATAGGLVKTRVNDKRQDEQVFSDADILDFARKAVLIEKSYGPKEIECAITSAKKPVIVETRSMLVVRKEKTADNITIIYPGEASARVNFAESIFDLPQDCHDKIIATNNIDINFITLLVYKYKPKAVICLQGNITSHASTILRESRTVSYIIPGFKLENNALITIHKDGSHAKIG